MAATTNTEEKKLLGYGLAGETTSTAPATAAQSDSAQAVQTQNPAAGTGAQASAAETLNDDAQENETSTLSAYQKAMAALAEAEKNAPVYAGKSTAELDEAYNAIVGRESFKYTPSQDALYQQMKEQYASMGQLAMKDTMGQAAALTGGYGSSYGQSVGQQQYDAYLKQLSDAIPELYGQARSAYDAEGDRLNQRYAMAGERADDEYAKYADEYNRYINERAYLGDRANDEYSKAADEAALMAQFGDFSTYKELFGEEKGSLMAETWYRQNPSLALKLGLIDKAKYKEITGGGSQQSGYNYGGTYNEREAELQRMLNAAGANLAVDGISGQLTEAAAAQHQDVLTEWEKKYA